MFPMHNLARKELNNQYQLDAGQALAHYFGNCWVFFFLQVRYCGVKKELNERPVWNRPEVRKLLLFYFYFFSTWS